MSNNTSNSNPLFGGKPATSLFGNTTQTNTQPNSLANAPPLGTTTQNQPTGSSIFGQQNQQPQQQQQPATAGSLFGNTTTTNQPTTSLFGNSSTQQQPAAGGGPFGNTQQTGSSLFGNTGTQQQQQQQQQQQPATGGSIFGSTTQQPAQQTGTTSLFGNTGQQQTGNSLFGNASTSQPQTGTSSLFGNATNQPQTGTTSLFGNTANQPQTGTTSLFGNTGTQQTGGTSLFGNAGASGQQQQGGTSLFGNTSTANQPQTGTTSLFGNTAGTSNLFGSTTTQQQPQAQPLFGSTIQPTQSTGFGTNSLFGPKPTNNVGSPYPLNAQPNQQAQSGQFTFTKSTKFNDLPDSIKQLLESIDTHIQGRVQISKDLHQRKLGEEPTKGQEMIKAMQKELHNTTNVIRNDLRHTEDLKAKVDQAMQDTIVASRIIDAFRNPQSGTTYLKDHAGFPFEFFQRVTQQMVERLTWYKATIEQIERRLSSSAGQTQTPQSIAATLQAQNATFLALASKTAALEAELQKVKALYTQLWRAKTGSVRDPFNEGDRLAENPGDLGFGGLVVK